MSPVEWFLVGLFGIPALVLGMAVGAAVTFVGWRAVKRIQQGLRRRGLLR